MNEQGNLNKIVNYIDTKILYPLINFYDFIRKSLKKIFWPPVSPKLLIQQMEFIGVKSTLIIVLAGIMIGAVFSLQFGRIFEMFGVESMIGAAASFALSKELAPVIGSFLVTGRAGSAIAAEIANMRVNEQIDAMRAMGVSPFSYLVAPRILASMIMMPLLCVFFIIFGMLSCYFIGVVLFDVDEGFFLTKIQWITKPRHVMQGLEKAVIFGFIFSTISCYQGFYASGGAKGVGKATTRAVVVSLVIILICDFFISYFQMEKIF